MKLKELHKGIGRYLVEDCYCSGEIYESNGIFFNVFDVLDDCKFLCKSDDKLDIIPFISCICKDKILVFSINTDNEISDSVQYPATENNMKLIKEIAETGKSDIELNSFSENEDKTFEHLCNLVDIIMG